MRYSPSGGDFVFDLFCFKVLCSFFLVLEVLQQFQSLIELLAASLPLLCVGPHFSHPSVDDLAHLPVIYALYME